MAPNDEAASATRARAELERRFRQARSDPALAVLEGFHALKHAIRFGAAIEIIVTRDIGELVSLALSLAPDVGDTIRESAEETPSEVFARLATPPPDTGVIAIAHRPAVCAADLLANGARSAPAVLLDHPAHRGNVGAAIRVAAAAGASAVITTGPLDPWDPAVLRGSAGLHFAIAVARAETLDARRGPLIAVDPNGKPLDPDAIPANARARLRFRAYGTESRAALDRRR